MVKAHWPRFALMAVAGASAFAGSATGGTGRTGSWGLSGGRVSAADIAAMREKCERYPWARSERDLLLRAVKPWLDVPLARLRELTPRRRGNVYHNFSCPDDRAALRFEPFEDTQFTCPTCGKVFPADQASNVYALGTTYHGTFYDGWACLYFINIAKTCWRLSLAYHLTSDDAYARRAGDILLVYADILPHMPRERVGGSNVVFTYNREGEVRLLEFSGAYDLIRGRGVLTALEEAHIEADLIRPFCDDVFMDPELRVDWNNVYWWQLAIIQVGMALRDRHYLDYAFGVGEYSPAARPEHRSLAYCLSHHFKPDGAYYGLNTGYQLYPLMALVQSVVCGRNLARQDPDEFPPKQFDYTSPEHPIGNVAARAVHWYLSLALPDRTMAVVGDSMLSRDSLKHYDPCAEVAYGVFGIGEVGEYPEMRSGRGFWGLLWGAPEINKVETRFETAHLSSGFTALRRQHGAKRVYASINHLLAGSGHQHADRLGIITYACDRLLGHEKGTPYNNESVRAAGTASYSHNTVTVDRTSQKRGNLLRGDEVPAVHYLQSTPVGEYVEVWGDGIHPQTSRYRRVLVLVGDLLVDVFDVVGGEVHDWFYHSQGSGLSFSRPLDPVASEFDTPAYLVGGRPGVASTVTDESWQATWTIPPEPESPHPGRRRALSHRLTMLGSVGTEVFHLKTFPAQPPMKTADGFTHSVMARRQSSTTPFVAVYDTYHVEPSLVEARTFPAATGGAVCLLLSTRHGRTLLLLNREGVPAVRVEAGIAGLCELRGHAAVVRFGARGAVSDVLLVDAEELVLRAPRLRLALPHRGSVCLTRSETGVFAGQAHAAVAFETIDGRRLFTPAEAETIRVEDAGVSTLVAVPGMSRVGFSGTEPAK